MFRMFETSQHARLYTQYRPDPPASLISRVVEYVRAAAPLGMAVDVGCGTGQNSRLLAQHFDSVLATDVSPAQVAAAAAAGDSNGVVRYETAPAEQIPAADGSVHLVTASMCYHFFDGPRFLAEADRVLVPGGVVALYGYREPHACLEDGSTWADFDNVVIRVSDIHLASYWVLPLQDKIRTNREAVQLIGYPDATWDDENFFKERPLTLDNVLGEISTWSGFQNMMKSCGEVQGEELLRQTRAELQAVIDEGEKRGVNIAAATERRQCFLMLARKPCPAVVLGQ